MPTTLSQHQACVKLAVIGVYPVRKPSPSASCYSCLDYPSDAADNFCLFPLLLREWLSWRRNYDTNTRIVSWSHDRSSLNTLSISLLWIWRYSYASQCNLVACSRYAINALLPCLPIWSSDSWKDSYTGTVMLEDPSADCLIFFIHILTISNGSWSCHPRSPRPWWLRFVFIVIAICQVILFIIWGIAISVSVGIAPILIVRFYFIFRIVRRWMILR